MNKVLLSACLLGRRVRYDGGGLAVTDDILARWQSEGRVVTVCPEVDAGMAIPRSPAEIQGGDGRDVLAGSATVMERDGGVVTDAFRRGAELALAACQRHGIRVAVLTESSPSCGSQTIYDGRFAGHKRDGVGVTTALLTAHGIQVFSQHRLAEADAALRASPGAR
ncbi:DUF523 domain-containing protein [Marinobacter xestospongiae]|uniref:DUF523 domain-containing protein n=1 Tax=Marinobacter xestospongiae TaxID=994319 RepID=UPI002006C93C|nr:DUF523 domain-containing protein [Marinobacter xestospongiae]MCK7568073.1 DUF523 domain-containing protein [Marinobacter xestospongiae]